jgi:hypothetical protein
VGHGILGDPYPRLTIDRGAHEGTVFPRRRQRKAEPGRALVDVEPHEVCDGDHARRRRLAGSSRIGFGRLELVSDGRLDEFARQVVELGDHLDRIAGHVQLADDFGWDPLG